VEITGTGFTGTTALKFNTTTATNITVNSDTKITAKVPAGATTGKINVANPAGNDDSPTDFSVTPVIASLNPTTGATGATVTIAGTNLLGATVKFSTATATKSNNTATSITVIVPAALSGAVNVSVTNAGGTSNAKTFTVTSSLEIDEIVATQNIKDQLLLIRGSNLTGATKVSFGTTEAVILTNTSKVITALIPSSLSLGTHSVKVTTANGTSNGKNFELLNTQNDNTGGVALVNGAAAASLPAGYVPPVSNQWENEFDNDQRFLISGFSSGDVEVTFSEGSNFFDGVGFYDQTNVGGVLVNYIEFTVNGVRYCGVWLPPS
jgi:hypothetical protein